MQRRCALSLSFGVAQLWCIILIMHIVKDCRFFFLANVTLQLMDRI